MGDAPKVSGPDLTAGIDSKELNDGQPLLGHVGDESVMVVRRGDEILAVGATCTHYSGPLAEGLVVGDTVRCPWHHACFDLRTGQAVRAPALSPIACFAVERDGDIVKVGERLKPAPVTPPQQQPQKIVIVGAGAAGHACAEELRARGYRGQLVLIGADADGPVDRPNLSKDYLAGTAPEEWIPLRGKQWYAEHGIELAFGSPVVNIDVAKHEVTLVTGRSHHWDKLLLATGADPIKLDIEGADHPQVHYLRSLADSRALIAATSTAKRVVVVGASFIGLEVAASLRARDLEVHVVAPEELPLQKVMGPELGAFLKSLHESHGVRFHLGRKPQRISPTSVILDDGTELPAELVVVGIGVRPALALAEKAGLTMETGVIVDDKLESSVPGIYVAGDLATWPDRRWGRIRVEHWVVAERQGQTAARNMLGLDEKFDAVPFFWSQHYDVGINYVGHGGHWDRTVLDGDPAAKDCTVSFYAAGKLTAVATIYRDRASLEAEVAFEEQY
jgi:NADPH-dependent 2,4-dienoyl-CoA reductase/sulfur reductase-like enzyme/nitrite reductase/ring-hydroxylating ferredoxin subunit